MARLDARPSTRKLRTSRRSLTGRLVTADGEVATFESSLERDWLMVLDLDPAVQSIEVQPFTLLYEMGGVSSKYTPDVLARFDDSERDESVTVYEVKPADELRKNWAMYRPRFKAALRYCRAQGWRFRIVTERQIRTPMLTNARFLRRYRSIPVDSLACKQLEYALHALGPTTPQALLAGTYFSSDSRLAALPMLWKMIACRQIAADLASPLTMTSRIWLAGDCP